ncbi:MAG: hypothetical protein CVT67_04135 [Actinobacteria bacterium HGW-Actinobacteria-7]|nr:MAG: hypothetical protein CVT67_04135 [Actinobacteria bacterium HGW-Actinobacteria-7]
MLTPESRGADSQSVDESVTSGEAVGREATPYVTGVRPRSRSTNLWFFAGILIVLITLVTGVIFIWLGARTERLVRDGALEQARSYADLIIAARAWNSHQGGVLVKKSATTLTNPYLIELGINPDDRLSDGTPVTLRNPAVMTREIGEELVAAHAASVFKLTSLRPVNPSNAPDSWERQGLRAFERGELEYWETDTMTKTAEVFRYMRPLIVDASCLRCHSTGYEVGDIRGAVSITLPYDAFSRAIRSNRIALLWVATTVLSGLWVTVLGLIWWLRNRLRAENARLERMATIDPLTGLWNRQHTLERLHGELERARRSGHGGTGVVMIDIDRFKRVNDEYGHAAGDEVLRRTAGALTGVVREYDLVGRIGGEELLVVAPDTDAGKLSVLAERLRAAVEGMESTELCGGCVVTVSIGTALALTGGGENADAFIARADAALYQAKAEGRNRVVAG